MIGVYSIVFSYVLIAALIFLVAIAFAVAKRKPKDCEDHWESWDQ